MDELECQGDDAACAREATYLVLPQVTGGPYPDPHNSPWFHVCSLHVGWAADHYKGAAIAKRLNKG